MDWRVLALGLCLCATVSAQSHCKSSSFTAEIKSGETFNRALGDGLSLVLLPSPDPSNPIGYPEQWTIYVHDRKLQHRNPNIDDADYIYPVNPPLRGNPSQIVGAVYGLTVKESLEIQRDLFFLLNPQDYEKMNALTIAALWPYTVAEPEKTSEKYLNGLSKVPLGELKFTVLDYELGDAIAVKQGDAEVQPPPEAQIINRLKFEVEVIVPATFPLERTLHSTSTACPKVNLP